MNRKLQIPILLCFSAFVVWAQVHPSGKLTQGPATSRPSSCKPGDSYFAADTNEYSRCERADSWSTFREWSSGGLDIRSRSVVDVTEFGARGDGVSDNTMAIQAAINKACARPGGGTVFFPPPVALGGYKVAQPQAPNNGPIFTFPGTCSGAGQGIHIMGGAGNYNQNPQFSTPPQILISVNQGATPGLGPVFLFAGNSPNAVTMENMHLSCYNQCVQVNNSTGHRFTNNSFLVQNTRKGILVGGGGNAITDNVPLALYNAFWIWVEHGMLGNENFNSPVVLLAGIHGAAGPVSGLITFRDMIWSGGGLAYDQRIGQSGAPGGNISMQDITVENAGEEPILHVYSDARQNSFGPIHLEDVNQSDNTPGTPGLRLDAATQYTDFFLQNIMAGTNSVLIRSTGNSSFYNCEVMSGSYARAVVDANGNAVPGCTVSNQNGFDFVSPNSAGPWLRTDMNTTDGFFGGNQGPPVRMTKAGDRNASLSIDPLDGMQFGPGGTSSSGYDTRFYRKGNQQIGLAVAQAEAPNALTARLTAGGTLTAGTVYIYFVESTITASSCSASNLTGPSQVVSATPTTENRTTLISWRAATGTAIAGYCVWRRSSSHGEFAYDYVAGKDTSNLIDNGDVTFKSGSPSQVNNTFPADPTYTFGLAGFGSSNGNTVGRVTLSGGTKAIPFSPAYIHAPVCMTNDEAIAGASKAIVTNTTLTIFGGKDDVVDYLCIANPN